MAKIAVRPSIKTTILDRGHVVRNEVRTEFITLVDDGTKSVRLRLEGQPVRIAKPIGKDAMAPRLPIDLPDRCPVLLRLDTILGNVAVRADAGVQKPAILTGDETLVMIDRTSRQFGQYGAGIGDLRVSWLVGIADDRVGIGDIKIVSYESYAEWRIEMFKEGFLDPATPSPSCSRRSTQERWRNGC